MSVSSGQLTGQFSGQVPRISGTIQRPRLLDRLRAARDYKLTLISAPPGYGKTTLAVQFAYQAGLPVAWHAIEERDRDVPNLHAKALAALQYIVPDIGRLPTPERRSPTELASLVANHLRERLSSDILLVIDDVQNLAGSPAAESWLRAFVTLSPPNCHLLLIGRILPDLPLTEMIARREVMAIGQRELQFTATEISQLSRELQGTEQTETDAQRLADRLEGWPAGVILALQPLPADLEGVMLSGGKGPEALFDALASQTLDAQSVRLRNFLLASSTLSRLTPELCESALQIPDSAALIDEAQSRSLFLSRIAGGLVYHALFRNFLQRQLQATDPLLFSRLHARAALYFEARDQLDDAFEHYLNAGEVAAAAAISERLAQSYFAQGKLETLIRWSDLLAETNADAPWLYYTSAMIYTDRYEYDRARDQLERAAHYFAARMDEVGEATVQLQYAMINLQQALYFEAADQAAEFADRASVPVNLRARALNILGFAKLNLGDTEAAVQALERALPLYREDGDAYALSQLLQNLQLAYSRLGRLDDSGACLQEVVALRRSLASGGSLALALNNLGFYYHLRSNYGEAFATFQEGLSVATRVPDRRAESYLLWSLGDLQRDQGAFEQSLEHYDRSLDLLGTAEPALRSSILLSMAILRRWQGQHHQAITLAEEALAVARAYSIALERALAEAVVWATRAELGEAKQALRYLEMSEQEVRQQGAKFELLRLLGMKAHVAALAGYSDMARADVRAALDVAKEAGSGQPFVTEILYSPALDNLSARLLPPGIMDELKTLRETRCQQEDDARVSRDAGPQVTYSIRVYSLGHEIIERDGKPVSSSEWRATSAREMLLYLLFVGPQTREEFSLAFWPESSASKVRSNFHTTLYRARNALGEDAIVFQNGLYMINPDIDARTDAQEMMTLSAQARLLSPRDVRAEDLWSRAVALYRGDFLPSLDADWVYPIRESLREAHIDALIGMSKCARARQDYREALQSLRRALDIDPFREDIHRAIMTCYADKGEKKKIKTHLSELQQLLWQELAVKPSSETMALVNSLLN